MKKPLLAILMIVYLGVSCGVVVNFHFCMNKLDSAKLYSTGSKTCGKCGMHIKKSHGCCRDEVKVVKLSTDQKSNPASFDGIATVEPVALVPSQFMICTVFNAPVCRSYYRRSPPSRDEQGAYLMNSVFRI